MIVGNYRAGTQWSGQKIVSASELFGKNYYWMQDIDGTLYLAKVGNDGNPDLT